MADVGWTGLAVALGFAGVAVLAYCAFRVYLGVRRFGRELERTRARLAPKHRELRGELHRLQRSHAPQDPGDGVRSG
ncbi:hypothetical protein BTM25_56200 [Actinomadura rubteroloni]|uniref:Uncharacterized protein n=1 Tax=Actinomadura rubteroloni TaxID=1926885 RepID=A0A2P4UAZ0_9ACTN|nr:hypothetical protein BTM25_56200 [Actinomadura rubteroloni]